jgi:hypothetical protein
MPSWTKDIKGEAAHKKQVFGECEFRSEGGV